MSRRPGHRVMETDGGGLRLVDRPSPEEAFVRPGACDVETGPIANFEVTADFPVDVDDEIRVSGLEERIQEIIHGLAVPAVGKLHVFKPGHAADGLLPGLRDAIAVHRAVEGASEMAHGTEATVEAALDEQRQRALAADGIFVAETKGARLNGHRVSVHRDDNGIIGAPARLHASAIPHDSENSVLDCDRHLYAVSSEERALRETRCTGRKRSRRLESAGPNPPAARRTGRPTGTVPVLRVRCRITPRHGFRCDGSCATECVALPGTAVVG